MFNSAGPRPLKHGAGLTRQPSADGEVTPHGEASDPDTPSTALPPYEEEEERAAHSYDEDDEDDEGPDPQGHTLSALRRQFAQSRRSTSEQTALMSFVENGGLRVSERVPLLPPSRLPNPFPDTPHRSILWFFQRFLVSSYLNLLIPAVPLGIIAGAAGWDNKTVFTLNLLAIFPLSGLIQVAFEELFVDLNHVVSYIVTSITDGTTDLIVIISAASFGEATLAQAYLIGCIACNLLLGFGLCTVTGGIFHLVLNLKARFTIISPVLAVSCIILALPAFASDFHTADHVTGSPDMLLSYTTSVILLALFVTCLVFTVQADVHERQRDEGWMDVEEQDHHSLEGLSSLQKAARLLSVAVILISLIALAVMHVRFVVQNAGGVVDSTIVSKKLIGFVLLPIAANAHLIVYSCLVAAKGEFEIVSQILLAENIRTTTFTAPFMVIFAQFIGKPIALDFTTTETVVLLFAVALISIMSRNLKTNYLSGMLCLGSYGIAVLTFLMRGDV